MTVYRTALTTRGTSTLALLSGLVGATSVAGTHQDTTRTVAQSPHPQAPSVGLGHMVYDANRRRLLVLAAPRQAEREELWEWEGERWVLIPSTGPMARQLGAAAYDSRRQRLVLHGGFGLTDREDRRGDTWEWDGSNWHQMSDASIGTRDHHRMVYDEARGRTVLYGGVKAGERLERATWEWDGNTWRQVSLEGPGGRAHFPMAYDDVRKQVVLFGGMGEGYQYHNDTWGWDGTTWRKLSEAGPSRRSHLSMAFDRQAGVMVLFGGLAEGKPDSALADTWLWDGRRWKEIPAPGPPKRAGHVMSYDASRGRVVLFGGGSWDGRVSTRYSDMWEWDGNRWSRRPESR